MSASVMEKLLNVQQELKTPKARENRFGGYNYRSVEDIYTALKPLLKKHKLALSISDDIELIGERYYIKATVALTDIETGSVTGAYAYARETFERKKSDDSQLTGAASSYARKYALGGLFLIDDAPDADTYEDAPDQEEEKPSGKHRKGEDKYYYIEEDDNVVTVHDGDPAPENGLEITKEQYIAGSKVIASGSRKKVSVKQAIAEAGFINIPEGVDMEVPFEVNSDQEDEEKPKTRRSRRKRA